METKELRRKLSSSFKSQAINKIKKTRNAPLKCTKVAKDFLLAIKKKGRFLNEEILGQKQFNSGNGT